MITSWNFNVLCRHAELAGKFLYAGSEGFKLGNALESSRLIKGPFLAFEVMFESEFGRRKAALYDGFFN